jgi:hypothetical protein
MNKILTSILAGWVLILGAGCAPKEPFKEARQIENSAVVYIYRLLSHGNDDVKYRLFVNGEKIDSIIAANEYVPLHIKTGEVTISAVAKGVIEHSVTMNVQNAQRYFVKLTPTAGGDFTCKTLEPDKASSEIATTFLSGSVLKIDPTQSKIIQTKTDKQTPASASEEISKLYEMNQKGIITDEEFAALKAKVIEK